jgi:hypothetical protein
MSNPISLVMESFLWREKSFFETNFSKDFLCLVTSWENISRGAPRARHKHP